MLPPPSPFAPPAPLPPNQRRSCQQRTVGNLTNTNFPLEDYTTQFLLGVEAVVSFLPDPTDSSGVTSHAEVPLSWEPALVTAIAAEVGVPALDVSASFLPGFGSTFQLWIRVSNLDGTATPTA